ncbi:type II toxin-antitoxin system PemI/MazE family antitoxin [Loigolactobacillus coryniformis]|uniref:AbrB/MazE/SpoVT family DNA-binding domain-containing protein n=1 Tax=Loigolactobacillus coryniformis TaxID=1610 RepID=A0A5B8TH21_9LACO|nr:AbrB/MazE/SpoVT family DNA-binding domain-containing protein [Loigolactobacillus coryniformis]QEA53943.1 AbrB/MazE/SpoVT family DNA-binding domain-containing protein [Loigolactobacillus coryniformis]RRG02573.1 MAG: AbrB/MazE/SpoVT family DNA-binding domain-containing protein [Lactobacillus sp.]
MKVKVRTVGNSTTLTIPKAFNIAPGTEFEVDQQRDGSIVFKPKHRNPFEGDWFNADLKQTDVTSDAEEIDSEWN